MTSDTFHKLARAAIELRESVYVELFDPQLKEPRHERLRREVQAAHDALDKARHHLNAAKELQLTIVGMTEIEMLHEFRDFVTDGVPASGPHRPAAAIVGMLFPLMGRKMGELHPKREVRDDIRALFKKARNE